MAQKPRRKTPPTASQAHVDGIRPSLQYSVLCDAVQQLPDGGTVIVRPFDTINRVGDNVIPASFVIFDGWTSGMGVWNEHLTITDPAGKTILEVPEQSFWLQSVWHRHNVQHNLTVALTDPGTYAVHVFLANSEILTYRFRFVVHPAPKMLGT